ncbi:hypothetical protein RRG08_054419 [Elysia crispata]|uniref:Uncharacterized protein n=1 Tax=Elysia crispata TaxID=231223 RepID=A0AAE1AVH9_9GAST|nr:hypothetical protein RRG08_054419 [Elysia crispata]
MTRCPEDNDGRLGTRCGTLTPDGFVPEGPRDQFGMVFWAALGDMSRSVAYVRTAPRKPVIFSEAILECHTS